MSNQFMDKHIYLWDKAAPLYEIAKNVNIKQKISETDPQTGDLWLHGEAINVSNKQLKVSLWGPSDRLTLSVGKTDIWDRRQKFEKTVTLKDIESGAFSDKHKDENDKADSFMMGHPLPDGSRKEGYTSWFAYDFPCPKPAGQIIVIAPDFKGVSGQECQTACVNGQTRVSFINGDKELCITYLVMMNRNIIHVQVEGKNLDHSVAFRIFRHKDTSVNNYEGYNYEEDKEWNGAISSPVSGADKDNFWIYQRLPAEKTFPEGFDYVIGGIIEGENYNLETANGETNLGTEPTTIKGQGNAHYLTPFFMPDYTRIAKAEGSSVTAVIEKKKNIKIDAYFCVVTANDAIDVIDEVKIRLQKAKENGHETLSEENRLWYQNFYNRRENGRIFFDTPEWDEVYLKGIFKSWTCSNSRSCLPDPLRYEADTVYAPFEYDKGGFYWHCLPCYNDIYDSPWELVLNRADRLQYWPKLVQHWFNACKENAREVFGKPGFFMAHGYLPPIKGDKYVHVHSTLEFCMEIPAQVIKVLWDIWDYSGEELFLEYNVYPALRELAIFYMNYVTLKEDGYYHIIPTVSAEHWGIRYQFKYNQDSTSALTMFKWAFVSAASASEILGVDGELKKEWLNIASFMAPYPVYNTENGPVFTDVAGVNPSGYNYNHFAGWTPVLLSGDINLDSEPHIKQTMLNTVNLVNGWHKADVPYLIGYSKDVSIEENSWFHRLQPQRSFDSENSIMKILQNEPERLLNSRSGWIHIFPAIPASISIAFKNFQARGGFLISAEQKGGKVVALTIEARRDIECKLFNPWDGDKVIIKKELGTENIAYALHEGDRNRIIFKALKGTKYSIFNETV